MLNDGQSIERAPLFTVVDGAVKEIMALPVNVPSLQIASTAVTATAAELNYNDIATLGTAQASKAVTVSAASKITLGAIEIEGSNFDIDGGTIDGATGTFTTLASNEGVLLDNETAVKATIGTDTTRIYPFDDGSSVRMAVTKDDNATETVAYMAEMTDALNSFVAGLPFYVGDGTDDYLASADGAAYEMGTGDFGFYNLIRLSDYTPSAAVTDARHANLTDNLGWILTLGTDGKLTLAIGNGTNFTTYAYTSTLAVRHADNYPALIGFGADRDGNVTFYDWFGSLGTAVMSGSSAQTVTCTNAAGLTLFQNINGTTEYDFRAIWMVRYFNMALSYADMMGMNKCLLPYSYGGASRTAKYTSDFSAGADGWVASQGTVTGNIDGIGGQDNNLRFTINANNNTHKAIYSALPIVGKYYTCSFKYYIPSGQSNIDGIRLLDGSIDAIYTPIQTATDTWTTVTATFLVTRYTGIAVAAYDGAEITFQDAGGDDVFYIREITVTSFGNVLDLNPSGFQAGFAKDASGNGLDATVTGAVMTNSATGYVMGNNTPEDTDGGRESDIRAYGIQSGGEKTTLGYMRFSHDGASDDEKGKFQLYLNDTNDGNVPSVKAIEALSTGAVNVLSLQIASTAVTSTAGELNYNDITTLGTAEASKAVTVSAGSKITLGAIEIEGSNFDIDGGTIDGVSISSTSLKVVSSSALTLGGFVNNYSEATATLTGATTTIEVNIPAISRITGVQLRVDTEITSISGTTWSASFSGGSTSAICSGQAFTKNTKVNSLVNDIITSEADIVITPDTDGFTAGVIRAVVYYTNFTAMGDL